eukprot:g14201.t1
MFMAHLRTLKGVEPYPPGFDLGKSSKGQQDKTVPQDDLGRIFAEQADALEQLLDDTDNILNQEALGRLFASTPDKIVEEGDFLENLIAETPAGILEKGDLAPSPWPALCRDARHRQDPGLQAPSAEQLFDLKLWEMDAKYQYCTDRGGSRKADIPDEVLEKLIIAEMKEEAALISDAQHAVAEDLPMDETPNACKLFQSDGAVPLKTKWSCKHDVTRRLRHAASGGHQLGKTAADIATTKEMGKGVGYEFDGKKLGRKDYEQSKRLLFDFDSSSDSEEQAQVSE